MIIVLWGSSDIRVEKLAVKGFGAPEHLYFIFYRSDVSSFLKLFLYLGFGIILAFLLIGMAKMGSTRKKNRFF